jgi:hypothetical protein
MNADETRMNADKAMRCLNAELAQCAHVHETPDRLIRVHPGFICVHLRFKGFRNRQPRTVNPRRRRP